MRQLHIQIFNKSVGLDEEGLLRVSGSNAMVQFYKDQFDRGISLFYFFVSFFMFCFNFNLFYVILIDYRNRGGSSGDARRPHNC